MINAFTFGLLLNFLPLIIAKMRRHRNSLPIGFLNFLTLPGWMIFGYVADRMESIIIYTLVAPVLFVFFVLWLAILVWSMTSNVETRIRIAND